MGNNGMKMIFGPNGQSHMAFKAGGMTFVDGKSYVKAGNMALGSDGSTHLKVGNAIFSNDGKTHLAFGDNPTFIV